MAKPNQIRFCPLDYLTVNHILLTMKQSFANNEYTIGKVDTIDTDVGAKYDVSELNGF